MLESILEICWPRECPLCGSPSDRPQRFLCTDCLNRLEVPGEWCGNGFAGGEEVPAGVKFEGSGRQLVHAFKFYHATHLLDDLTDLLEAAAANRYRLAKVELVVPIPLIWYRRYLRGYNQSALLAKHLASRIGCAYSARCLSRIGFPRQQSHLAPADREANVKGTFRVPPRAYAYIKDKTILLVDDVCTTGATLAEAARVLRAAGAAEVLPVALAKA